MKPILVIFFILNFSLRSADKAELAQSYVEFTKIIYQKELSEDYAAQLFKNNLPLLVDSFGKKFIIKNEDAKKLLRSGAIISKNGANHIFEVEKSKYIKAFSVWLSASKNSLRLESYKNMTLKHLNMFRDVKDQDQFLSSLKDFTLIKENSYIEEQVASWILKNPIAFLNRSSLDNLKEYPKLRSEILSSYVDLKGIDKTILNYLVLYDFDGKLEALLVKTCLEYIFESDTYNQNDNLFRLFLKLAQKGKSFKLIPKDQITEITNSLINDELSAQKFSFYLSILYHHSQETFLSNYNFLLRKFCDTYRLNKIFQEGADTLPLNELLLFRFLKVDKLNSLTKKSLSELALSKHDFQSAKSGLNRIIAISIVGMYDKELYKELLSKSKIYELFYSHVSGSYIMYPFYLNYGLLKFPEPRIGELNTNMMGKRKSLYTALNLLDNYKNNGNQLDLAILASGLQMRTKDAQERIIKHLGLDFEYLVQNKKYFMMQVFQLGGEESIKYLYEDMAKNFDQGTSQLKWNSYFDLIFSENLFTDHQEKFIKLLESQESPDKDLISYIIKSIKEENVEITKELINRMIRTENPNILISIIKNRKIKEDIENFVKENSMPYISLLGFSNFRPVPKLNDYSTELTSLYFILAILDQNIVSEDPVNAEINFFKRFGF